MNAEERRARGGRGMPARCPRRRGSAAPAVALLAAACLLRTAAAAALAPVNITAGRYPFIATASLGGLQYALYNIETPRDETTDGLPDLLIQLDSFNDPTSSTYSSPITSTADIYCNPLWVTQEGSNSVAQPGDALFYSESDVGVNDIYISQDDPVIRPPSLRNNRTAGYASFVPSFNCTVVNNDPSAAVHYKLTITPSFTDISLTPSEQTVINDLWNACCQNSITTADVNNAAASDGTTLTFNASDQNPVSSDTCGTWLLFNNLYGVTPFVDFCKVTGNVCNDLGQLTTLNLNAWNLACPFPAEQIGQLEFVENLSMNSNFNLTGNISVAFEALAQMPALVNVDFTNNRRLVGSWTSNTTYVGTQAPICKLAASGLATLALGGSGISGSEFPACLLGPHSTLEELHIEYNDLTGVIPDNFDSTSHLRVLTAWGNNLTGPIPSTLGVVPNMEVIDFTGNSMTGPIPDNIGASTALRFLYLGGNYFTGQIPSSIALHPTLEALDVSYNNLTLMPSEWYSTSLPAIASSKLINLAAGGNFFTGGLPLALAHLPMLEILNMDNTGLSGPLLAIADGFPALRWLNVSYNGFTGEIPSTYGKSGIFTLEPVAYASVALFQELSQLQDTGLNAFTGYLYGQVFDVSHNSFSGAVPTFLYANNVPPWTQPTVFLQANMLDIDCSNVPVQLQYIVQDHLGDAEAALCPQGVTADDIAAGASAPGVGLNAPAAGPYAANAAAAASPAAAPSASTSSGSSSDSGLSSGAKAGIAVGVILAAAALAAAGFLWHRQRSGDSGPSLPAMPKWASAPSSLVGSARSRFSAAAPATPTGFSKFSDLEMTSGMDRGPQPASLNFNAQMGGGGSNGFHA